MKEFFKKLWALLVLDPSRSGCPHSGGGRCFGACSIVKDDREKERRAPRKQDRQGRP